MTKKQKLALFLMTTVFMVFWTYVVIKFLSHLLLSGS